MTHRDDLRAEKALQGFQFPAGKDELLEYAETRKATDKTLQALRSLPNREFTSMDDMVAEVPQEPEGEQTPGGTAR